MSRLASVLRRLRELDSLTDGQLVRLKIGALLAGFITDADGTLLQEGATPGESSLEPGTMQRLKPGESVEFSKPPEIGAESNAFQKAVIREIGAGVGVPSFMLDHDLSEVNFSSARTAIIAFRRRIEAWRDAFAFQMLRPVYRRWLTVEVLSGRLGAIREPNGTRCCRPADLECQGAVADSVPDRDATQCEPDCPLEIRAIGSSRQAGDGVQISLEIGLK
jgi:lambda family phage portal protein